MGVFFYTNSVAFIEDVPLKEGETYQSEDELTNDIEAGFQQVSITFINCLPWPVCFC
jgi:hypothetical protein